MIKECGSVLGIFKCVIALSICIFTEQCFDFLSFNLLTTDLDQRGVKECSVSHSVAGQRLVLARKGTFLKKEH